MLLGWNLGRIVTNKPPTKEGKFWVTNGAINKMVNNIPEGFWKGKVQNTSKNIGGHGGI